MQATGKDPGIATLLDLDDSILEQSGGFWVKIVAKQGAVTEEIPHGIRYSLTLHNSDGTRVLGFDNAHAVKPSGKFKYAGQSHPFDHQHRHAKDKGVPYEFQDAHQLLKDFFSAVDQVLEQGKPP
jgi:hypothetical protein